MTAGGAGRRPRGDAGSAIVEFCFLGVLLMVPLVYLVLTAFAVQSAAYGVAAGAREAGRAFVTAPAGTDPGDRAFAAARISVADHGLTLAREQLALATSATGCLGPGDAVTARLSVDVALPLLPDALAGVVPASIPVEAEHLSHVDRFRAGSCLP